MAVDPDGIGIPIEPDLSGFSRKLESELRSLADFSISISGKPVLAKKFKSELDAEIKRIENSPSSHVNITPTVTKTSLNKFKSELSRGLESASGKASIGVNLSKAETTQLRRQIQTQVFDKPFQIKVEIQKGSLAEIKKALSVPITLIAPNKGALAAIKTKIERDMGPINIKVNASAGSITPVNNEVKQFISHTTQAVKQSATFSRSNRDLARDMTLLGRAATLSKASVFSFLGAITPGQVVLTAFSTGLIQATRNFIKFGVESSKSIQQTDLALKSFLGGNRAAVTAFINQMQNFAAVSPFNLESILKTSKLLLGAGQGVTKILPELKAIGGLGAQLGVSSDAISRVGTAIAKIAGQGKVTSRELRTIFTAFPGFQPIKALADNLEGFGGSTQKVLKAMQKGAIDANSAIDALINGMLQFPGAADALYRQSLLVAGSQETLKDRFEQVARAAVGPALGQLALNYREAAKVFDQQSKTGIGSGIRSLIRDGSDLLPILAKGLVPAIDSFAGGISTLIPPFKQFIKDFGGPLMEAFQAGLKLLPAFSDGLTLFVTVVKPAAPVIGTLAKALNAIPAPLISIVAAMKLLGSIAPGGLLGGLGLSGKGTGEDAPAKAGIFSKHLNDIKNGFTNIKSTVGTGIFAARSGLFGVGAFFDRAGARGFQNELDGINRKFENIKTTTKTGGFFNAAPTVVQTSILKKEFAEVEARGVTLGNKVSGAFSLAGAGIKSAGSSLLAAFGGPVGIAITGAVVGASALFDKYQKTKAEAAQVKKETELIGKELSLDSSASKGADRLREIIHKLATETEIAVKAMKNLQEGFSRISTKGISNPQLVNDLNTLKNGASENDIASLIGNQKRLKQVQEELKKQSGYLEGTGYAGFDAAINRTFTFGKFNLNHKEAQKALTQTRKINDEYLKSVKSSVTEELRIAKELDEKGLAKTFKKAQKDLEAGKDPSKVYDKIRGSINKLSVAQQNMDDSALKAAISGSGLTDKMKASTSATQAYNDAVDELNTALAELIMNQDNISADSVLKNTDPRTLGALSSQFASLAADPQAQTDFLKDVNAKILEITNDPTAAQAITKQIASWKEAAANALGDFKKAFTDNLPNLGTIFAEQFDISSKGPGLSELQSRLKKSVDYINKFTSNLNTLYKAGFKDLATTFAEQGPALAANALNEAVSKLGSKTGQKALTDLQNGLKTYKDTVANSGNEIRDVAKQVVGDKLGINPELIVDPSLSINAPSQAEIDAAASRLEEITAQIDAKRSEINKRNKVLKQHGEKSQGSIEQNPLYTELLAEQSRLQDFVSKAQKTIFTGLQNQATNTATAVNTTFSKIDVSASLKPGIDKATKDIASIATGPNSIGAQIAANFGPSLLNAKGSKSVVFKSNSAFDIKAIIGDTLANSAKSAGQVAGEAMAKGLQDGFSAAGILAGAKISTIATAILDPFRKARRGINKLLSGLSDLGKSLGVKIQIDQIPEFHSGGIVGEKAKMRDAQLKDRERLAVLLEGEAVLPNKVTSQMSKPMIKDLIKGDIDSFIPKYLNTKGGSNNSPKNIANSNAESAASFGSSIWLSRFNDIRDETRKEFTNNSINKIAKETFERSYEITASYTKKLEKEFSSKFGNVDFNAIRAMSGTMQQIVAQIKEQQGATNSYKALIAYMKASGVPFDVSSTVRPGSITSSGNKSYHGFGRAVDFVGKKASIDSPELGRIFNAFKPIEGLLAELIYSGPQTSYNIKDGKRVSKYAVADHHNHVHAALYRGANIRGSEHGGIYQIGENWQDEIVLPMSNPSRIMDLTTSAIRTKMLTDQGQQALLSAIISSNNNTHGTPQINNNGDSINIGDIKINVETPTNDPGLQAEIIAMRVRSALRRAIR